MKMKKNKTAGNTAAVNSCLPNTGIIKVPGGNRRVTPYKPTFDKWFTGEENAMPFRGSIRKLALASITTIVCAKLVKPCLAIGLSLRVLGFSETISNIVAYFM